MKFQKFLIFHLWVCVTDSPRWQGGIMTWSFADNWPWGKLNIVKPNNRIQIKALIKVFIYSFLHNLFQAIHSGSSASRIHRGNKKHLWIKWINSLKCCCSVFNILQLAKLQFNSRFPMSKFPPQGRRVGMSSLSDEKVEEELSKINPNVKVNI